MEGASSRRWIVLALVAITFGAMALRLAPLLRFTLWGSDWGEYYALTSSLVEQGYHAEASLGWGRAYVDFPGLFDLAGASALVMGVDADVALSIAVPCVTALSCLFVAIFALRLGGGPWGALFSAGVLAVIYPEVFQNSHAVPGPLGSVMVLAVMLVFMMGDVWRWDSEGDAPRPLGLYVLMLVLVFALVATHHMSLLFVLGAIVLANLFRAASVKGQEPEREWWGTWCLLAVVGLATVFWLLLAPTFRDEVMVDLFGWSGLAVMALLWVAILSYLVFLRLYSRSGRVGPFLGNKPLNPPFSSPVSLRQLFSAFLLCGTIIVLLVMVFGFPGTDIEVGAIVLPYFIPTLAVFALGVGSTDVLLRKRGGHIVLAWLLAVLASFLFAITTDSHVLLSYRHLPYIVEVSVILLGVGLVQLRRMTVPEGKGWSRGVGLAAALLITVLLVTSTPQKDVMGGFQEGTNQHEVDAVLWLDGGLPSPGAEPADTGSGVVATDHRLSSMAFGLGGQMATWDTAGDVLHGKPGQGTEAALADVDTPNGDRPVTAVLLSEDLREGAALYQWTVARPIDGEEWDKFFSEPFLRVFDNGDARVFAVTPF